MPGRKGQHGYYLGKMDELRRRRGGRCEAASIWATVTCAVTVGLEFAHMKPTRVWGRGRGRAERYHDIKRFPDAYALLCVKHHKKQEREVAMEKTRELARRGEEPLLREPGEDDE